MKFLNILCKLGIHKWRFRSYYGYKDGNGISFYECFRCKKEKAKAYVERLGKDSCL